jgi:hypothetical protein
VANRVSVAANQKTEEMRNQCLYIFQSSRNLQRYSRCPIKTGHPSSLCSKHRSKEIVRQFINVEETRFCQYKKRAIYTKEPPAHNLGSQVNCFKCEALLWSEENPKCCEKGRLICLPRLNEYPQYLHELLTSNDQLSIQFRENIRKYNILLSFGSLRASYSDVLARRANSGVYSYRINGITKLLIKN